MKFILFLIFMGTLCYTAVSITVMAIDLGSEWMKIAIVKPGVPMEIVLNKETKRKTEVAVAMKDGERLFGSAAVAQGIRFPKHTYIFLLDLLAKKMDNPLVDNFKRRYPYYDLVEDPSSGYVHFRHVENNEVYSPEELLAMTLNYSKSLAEEHARQTVDSAIITVPVYFNQAERTMLLYAAELAGLPSPQIMDVSTAAALNYGVFRRSDINATANHILFYDMGATSTTATIVAYEVVKVNGVMDPQLSVKGIGFDRTLGGSAVEFKLRDHLIQEFDDNKKTSMNVQNSPKAMAKLLKEARRLKLVLSANAEHHARVESLIDDEDFTTKVTREQLESLCAELWPRVAKPMRDALESAALTMDSISKIILVGGSTRIPKVQEVLLKDSGMPTLGKSLNADEAPALGASYEAAARSKGFRVKTFHIRSSAAYPIDIEFARTTMHDNGTQTVKHVRKTLFQRNNPYPQRKVITFNRFYSDFDFIVNYGDLKFLSEEQMKAFGAKNLSRISLEGVASAHEKHGMKNDTDSKGIKAHFRMDMNGLLNLDEVEALFETNVTNTKVQETEPTDDASAFEKLKNSFSTIFTGSDEANSDDDKIHNKEEEEEAKEVKSTQEEHHSAKKEAKSDADDQQKDTVTKSEERNEEETAALNETAKNKTNDEKQLKKIKISFPITKTETRLDFNEHPPEVTLKSKDKLKDLSEKDAMKIAREEAMNALEAYIYDKQDKVYQEEYEKAMNMKEFEEIPKALVGASDWMLELEEDAKPEVYKEKLAELKKLARPWLLRVKERQELEPLLLDMENIFNYTLHFLKAIQSLPKDDQIYTEVEINVLKKTYNDTLVWKNNTLKMQAALHPSSDNVMKPNDVKIKMGELNREIQYLLTKARTTKPKKKPEKKSNSTKTVEDAAVNKADHSKNDTINDENADESETETSEDEKFEQSDNTENQDSGKEPKNKSEFQTAAEAVTEDKYHDDTSNGNGKLEEASNEGIKEEL